MTPLATHRGLKLRLPDMLVMVRAGDFLEAYDGDAGIIAAALDLVVTARADAPMCGFPAARMGGLLECLLKLGHRVVLTEAW